MDLTYFAYSLFDICLYYLLLVCVCELMLASLLSLSHHLSLTPTYIINFHERIYVLVIYF